jgi:Leucine-rich repeat (LRR) protein
MHLVNARSLLVAALLLLTTQAAFIDDKTALTRLYEVSDGPRWTNHTNWGVTDNVCSWFGIACFSEKVISINLPNNNLVGRVSKFIYQMETLEQVRLKDNKLQSGSFEIFPGGDTSGEDVTISPLLKVLDFAGNALTDVTGVGNAPDTLEELHFTSNSIQGDFPVEITLLTKLKLLYLSFNKIAGTLPTEIGRMTGLQQFYSYGNLLTGQVPTEIGNLDKIEVFTLSENKLSGTIPTQVNAMFNLRIFSIHNNDPKTGKLSGKVPTFEKAPYLNEVYFDGNALTGSIPTELLLNSNITNNLVTIGLSNNLLVGSIPTSLLKFDSLFLDVTGNLLDVPLDAEFCTKGAWMNGLVEEHGCDAILCPAGQYVSQQGRATDEANCTSCTTNTGTLGATACDGLVLDDWFVLAIMYRDLGGSGWNKTDGWNLLESILDNGMVDNIDLTLINVCEWHGIICDNTKKVTEINLQNNGLIGTIPTELFQMPALSILDLSKNALDMDGFAALGASQSLLSLKLAGTKIRSVAGIEVAKSLRSLYLDGLDLGGKFPTQLYALTDLHLLHLQFTGLTGTLHTELGRMNKLRQ